MNQNVKKYLVYLLVGAACGVAAVRFFTLINRHAVNILFLDQWDFLTPLFGNPSWWQTFALQHGPHRQGLGLFVSQTVGALTNWDTRVECYVIGVIFVLATAAAINLKLRLFGKLTAWDALIPFITLSFTQIETAVQTPNPAHGALPLLLILLGGAALTLENKYWRYFGFVFLVFLTIFTGFGFFIGLVAPPVLLLAAMIHWRDGEKREFWIALAAAAAAILALASFFLNYAFVPAVDCFQFPHPRPFEYLTFISIELTTFMGFVGGYKASFARPFGVSLFFFFVGLAAYQLVKIWLERKFDAARIVIFTFISFSLLFAVNAAIGRICLSLQAAETSRYMPLLVPAFLALYFAAQRLQSIYLNIVPNLLLIVLFVVIPARSYNFFDNQLKFYSDAKRRWAACYLETENIGECDKFAGQPMYPAPDAINMKGKLDLLKEKRFNLFAGK